MATMPTTWPTTPSTSCCSGGTRCPARPWRRNPGSISRFENGARRSVLYRMGRELAACVIERHRRRLQGRARRSPDPKYQQLHEGIVRYLLFLHEKSPDRRAVARPSQSLVPLPGDRRQVLLQFVGPVQRPVLTTQRLQTPGLTRPQPRRVLQQRIARPLERLRILRLRGQPPLLGVLEGPPVREVRRDPRRPERVAARRGRKLRGSGPPLDPSPGPPAAAAPVPSADARPGPRSGRASPSAPRARPPRRTCPVPPLPGGGPGRHASSRPSRGAWSHPRLPCWK